jgi:hypothetical protein
MLDKIMSRWKWLQEFISVDGGIYIDAMCIVIVVRLLAVLKGYAPMTNAEAGLWSVTIATYGAGKFKGPKGGC